MHHLTYADGYMVSWYNTRPMHLQLSGSMFHYWQFQCSDLKQVILMCLASASVTVYWGQQCSVVRK